MKCMLIMIMVTKFPFTTFGLVASQTIDHTWYINPIENEKKSSSLSPMLVLRQTKVIS